jgi:hypothetical protein
MKLIVCLTIISFILSTLAATLSPNGERLVRGMGPLRPAALYGSGPTHASGLPPVNVSPFVHPSAHYGQRPTVARRAAPSSTPPGGGSGQCNTGSVQCCQSTGTTSGPDGGLLSVLLRIVGLEGIGSNILLGTNCSPLSGIGIGSGSRWLAFQH